MKPTVIRLTDKDQGRIKRLRENGYGNSTATIIRRALEEADNHEIERANVAWSRF